MFDGSMGAPSKVRYRTRFTKLLEAEIVSPINGVPSKISLVKSVPDELLFRIRVFSWLPLIDSGSWRI